MISPVSPWKAAALLCRLNWRRQLNQFGSLYRYRKTTSIRKRTAGQWFMALVAATALFGSFGLARQDMANIKKVLGSVQSFEEVRRGWLGIDLAPVTAEDIGIAPPGALLVKVAAAGPVQGAAVELGDGVVKLDDNFISEPRELSGISVATPVGETVPVMIVADGSQQRRTVKVGLRSGQAPRRSVLQAAPAPGSVLAPGVIKGAVFVSTLLLLAALLLTLAGRDIAQPEWDLEWLATLPLPMSTLLSSRLIQRVATNSIGFMVLSPFLSIVAWECGYAWTAPLLGLGLTFVLLFTAATVQTLVDTALRLSVPPPKLRNLQALISLVAFLPLPLAMAPLRVNSFVFGWMAGLPDWTNWLPTGLAVRALASADVGSAARWYTAMAGEVVVFVAIGGGLLYRQLRHGVVAAGAREAAVRIPAAAFRPAFASATWSLLSVVQRRELLLLTRDRAFLAQTLLVPAVVVGAQVLLNSDAGVFAGATEHPATLAVIAFTLAAYTLMFSAFQTISTEGQALWILFAVPQSLEAVLFQKAKLWAAAATVYPLLLFAIAGVMAGAVSLQFIGAAVLVLLGVPIFAVIATALGVLGVDPLVQEPRRRVRPTYISIYVTLVGLYGSAAYAITMWQRAATVILTGLLAVALWQRARDHADYLLDPTASPPSRVSVSDGMIAALLFFVLQSVLAVLFQAVEVKATPASVIWVAFTVAGATTYVATQLVYRLARTTGVPHLFGGDMPKALMWGAAGGLTASLAGVIYMELIAAMNLLPSESGVLPLGVIAVVVVGAPLFEEFIFRGLIFGGLRRSLDTTTATLTSAAIFALVHPPLSVVPVFALGVCAALVYQRTKILAAPILVHAIYNAAVLGFQWNVM